MSKNIFHIINKATKDHNLKHSDLRIFLCLISYNTFNKIFPSLETISIDTGIKSRPDISKGLKRLKELNYIEIKRRKHQTNIYKLNVEKIEVKKKEISEPLKSTEISYMNKAMLEVVAGEVAKAKGYSKPESSDFKFVNNLLKEKADDNYKEDHFNYIRKCLMILYLINKHLNKFSNTEYKYPYFKTVYSAYSYNLIHKDIFDSKTSIVKMNKPDIKIINEPSVNY